MDSLTHIVLGAAIGELMAGKKLGKKALLIGAVANSLPDIDFIASAFLPTAQDVWAHRGLTHSLLFIVVMTPLLTWLVTRIWPQTTMTKAQWYIFFSVQLFVHIFIDAFNAYGTGWFEPFSHYRVALHVLFVADPFFSVWLAIAFVALLVLRKNHPARKRWAWGGLALSTAYLIYCIGNKITTDAHARADLQGKSYTRYLSTPTPLNNWLWYVVAETDNGFYTGYHSVFDHQPVQFRFQPKNKALLRPFFEHKDLDYLLRFSQGFYTVERWGDTTVFNDLRFGEMKGWEDPKARFVFHYFLEYPDNNKIVVQRGRFAGWSWHTIDVMIRRIRGN